jgi:hypothetical protein
MPRVKKVKEENVEQPGVEEGLLPVLHDEETLRGRMGAISNEAERLRRELLTSYKALLQAEPRVHIAVTFMRDDLLTSNEAKAAILDYKVKDMKPTVDGIKMLVRLELEELETRYKLAKLEVERYDKDFDKLESQLSWHQSVLKNHGRVVQMGSLADQMYSKQHIPGMGEINVPVDEPKTPTLGGPFGSVEFDKPMFGDAEPAQNADSGAVEAPGTARDPEDHQLKAELEASLKEPEPVLPAAPAPTPELAPAAKAEIASFTETLKELRKNINPAKVKAETTGDFPTTKFPADPVAKTLSDMITTKQLGMIRAVAREVGVDADEECMAVMNCIVTELSRRAASAMIDHLRELQEKAGISGPKRQGPRDDENAPAKPSSFVSSLYGGSKPQVKLSDVRDPNEPVEAPLPTQYKEPDGKITNKEDDECPF